MRVVPRIAKMISVLERKITFRGGFVFLESCSSRRREKEVQNMTEYLTGVKQTAALEISELLADSREGGQVIVNGAVHTIRDMGNVSL